MIQELRDMILEYVDIEKDSITEEARFIEDLGFTSYDFMSMVGEIEEKYGIIADEKDIVDIVTVGQAVSYIESHRKSAAKR